jgi:alanyl-tRNA synthetase
VDPSNYTEGYVMRRFARRALRQGVHVGIESGLLARLVDVVVDIYSEAYPELAKDADRVRAMLDPDEDLFRRTLARAGASCPSWARDGLDGRDVLTLFDTYGFPPELSVEEAVAAAIAVGPGSQADYERLMAEQRERSRTAPDMLAWLESSRLNIARGMFEKGRERRMAEAITRLLTYTERAVANLERLDGTAS